MFVGISVKEILLDVVPVDVMSQPASVKTTHASVTSHVVPQQQSAVVVVSYSFHPRYKTISYHFIQQPTVFVNHRVCVGISVKEMLLDVVPMSVKDVMDQAARITVPVTKHVALQNHKLEAELKLTLYCNS